MSKEQYPNTRLGARCRSDGSCRFTVWAPHRKSVDLHLLSPPGRWIPMEKNRRGYWVIHVAGVRPGTLYEFRLDGELDRPDPASRFQPEGVHGPSAVVDVESYRWEDSGWKGLNLDDMLFYELHIGTFTPEGTFDAVLPRLDALKTLGINTIEIMPVSQFPGDRNWGYDGAYPYAVQNSYGGPEGLKRLVDACHQRQMGVFLDVVYNHLGPEGNYLRDYGPYFTDRYRTPWGAAVNFDGAYSDEVRRFFIENALSWLEDYHIDGLRLDALHAILDMSAVHFLRELSESVETLGGRLGRKLWLIGESDLNDSRLIAPPALGGYGLDGVWCDDFHHALHTLLTGEREGYYQDYGKPVHLVKALREGFVYSGEYSGYRKRKHGNSSLDRPARQFVAFAQNHDQIGNRMRGERLSQLVELEALKLAAAVVLLSPYVPLLFMGEEYGDASPFLYFVSHSDPELVEAVREGRAKEFERFSWSGEVPDPQAPETFLRSKLNWDLRQEWQHSSLLDFHQELIDLRRSLPALRELDRTRMRVDVGMHEAPVVWMERWDAMEYNRVLCLFNFANDDSEVEVPETVGPGPWTKRLDSSERAWKGPGTISPATLQGGVKVPLKRLSVVVFTASVD